MAPRLSSTLLRAQSDARLVELCHAGHERAFEAIVERYRRPLLRYCRRLLPEARAEDALQQAFLSAWTALRDGAEVRDLRPWLYRVARNAAWDAARRSGYDYDELHDALGMAAAADEDFERRLVVQRTIAGLARLPDAQREALLRMAVGGRSRAEVAREMGVSEGAVRQLVHRARVTLRSAATALTPAPALTWAVAAGREGEPVADRVAELVVGAGATGAAGVGAATVAKVGAVVVTAGVIAVGEPGIVREALRPEPARPEAVTTPARGDAPVSPASARLGATGPATGSIGGSPADDDRSGRRGGSGDDDDRSGRRGGDDDDDDRSGRRGGDEDDDDERFDDDSSGRGRSGTGLRGRDRPDADDDDSSGRGRSGTGQRGRERGDDDSSGRGRSGTGQRGREREDDDSSGRGRSGTGQRGRDRPETDGDSSGRGGSGPGERASERVDTGDDAAAGSIRSGTGQGLGDLPDSDGGDDSSGSGSGSSGGDDDED